MAYLESEKGPLFYCLLYFSYVQFSVSITCTRTLENRLKSLNSGASCVSVLQSVLISLRRSHRNVKI